MLHYQDQRRRPREGKNRGDNVSGTVLLSEEASVREQKIEKLIQEIRKEFNHEYIYTDANVRRILEDISNNDTDITTEEVLNHPYKDGYCLIQFITDIPRYKPAFERGPTLDLELFCKVVDLFIEYGVCVNKTTASGSTALMIATEHGDYEGMEYLLAKGAEVNAEDEHGITALMIAAVNDDFNAAELLIRRGADTNHETKRKQTPLLLATQYAGLNVIELFTKNSANINHGNDEQKTAAEIAAYRRDGDLLKYLLDQGASCQFLKKHGGKIIVPVGCGSPAESEVSLSLREYSFHARLTMKGRFPYLKTSEYVVTKQVASILLCAVDYVISENRALFFELQLHQDSGLSGRCKSQRKLEGPFNRIFPNVSYCIYHRGEYFLHYESQGPIVVVLEKKARHSLVNNKVLQLLAAYVLCNVPNNGTVYPESKIYLLEDYYNNKQGTISDIRNFADESGNRIFLKKAMASEGEGNRSVNIAEEDLENALEKFIKLHEEGELTFIVQKTVSCVNEYGEYETYRGLTASPIDEKDAQYASSYILWKTKTSTPDSHQGGEDAARIRELYFGNEHDSLIYHHTKYQYVGEQNKGYTGEVLQKHLKLFGKIALELYQLLEKLPFEEDVKAWQKEHISYFNTSYEKNKQFKLSCSPVQYASYFSIGTGQASDQAQAEASHFVYKK
jgi:hypothetical protein